MNKSAFGGKGEALAEGFLLNRGYKILVRNFRTKQGEIDIIAQKDGIVSFIEVKTRSSLRFGAPAEAVAYSKQQKIIATAFVFLQQHVVTDKPFQFDVMEVLIGNNKESTVFNHIQNAFGRHG